MPLMALCRFTVTPERAKLVDFVLPYYYGAGLSSAGCRPIGACLECCLPAGAPRVCCPTACLLAVPAGATLFAPGGQLQGVNGWEDLKGKKVVTFVG